ncbi:sulfotransferase family protein [uncultured Kordia sp.]|uniref:sulfotransferase family protein n=1 Tax=uncultured Kordia sp. TaxID=507699 RepID=UPI00262A0AA8|nr:sulfotransferase family protein [uncultured Kordia sp.]
MKFPEFSNKEKSVSMSPSISFIKGIFRRLFISPKEKIFVIGFHKTGTSSLGKALQMLGYRVCGAFPSIDHTDIEFLNNKKEVLNTIESIFDTYDAFQDTPWFWFYKELHERYPNAKFILSSRNPQKWMRSVSNHFGGNPNWKFHSWIYNGNGDPIGNEDLYIETFKMHNAEVKAFFEGNPNFLEMNLADGDNWNKLCSFLNRRKPLYTFPHVSSVGDQTNKKRQLIYKIKKMLGY